MAEKSAAHRARNGIRRTYSGVISDALIHVCENSQADDARLKQVLDLLTRLEHRVGHLEDSWQL